MIENFVVYKGGAYNETILFDAERFGGVNDDFMLDDSVLNYDTIIVTTKENDGLHSYYIPVSEFYASLNNPQRPWCNDGETLLIYPNSDFGVSVDSTSTAKIYKVIGVSNKHSKEDPETKVSTRLTSLGKQTFLNYCDTAYATYDQLFMIAPLVSVSETVLKYYDYETGMSGWSALANELETSDLPLARYDLDMETFKSLATVVETEDPNCPLYVYASTDNPVWFGYHPYMFYYCEKPLEFIDEDKPFINTLWNKFYQLSLRGADVSKMTNLDSLFEVDADDCSINPGVSPSLVSFDTIIDVTDWDVSNVDSMSGTFKDLGRNYYANKDRIVEDVFILGLDTWDVSNVTDMSSLFETNFDRFGEHERMTTVRVVKFDNWDVSLVSNANHMFKGFESYYIPLNLNFKNCKTMVGTLQDTYHNGYYFEDEDRYTLNWNTPKVRDMSYMFDAYTEIGYYGDTSSATNNFETMFNIENLNTSNVENMNHMFNYTHFRTFDLPHCEEMSLNDWDVSNVTNMEYMFSNMNSQHDTNTIGIDFSDWDVSYVKDMKGMFYTNMDYGYPMIVNSFSQWNTRNVQDFSHMFETQKPTGDWDEAGFYADWDDYENFDMRSATSVAKMFYDQYLVNDDEIDFSNWDTSHINDFTQMFGKLEIDNPTTIDLSNWDFSNVTDNTKMLLFDNDVVSHDSSITFIANNWKLGVYNQDILNFLTTAYSNHAIDTTLYVENWDISQIHSLNNLFEGLKICNEDSFSINSVNNGWNTSSIFDVTELFKDTDFGENSSSTLNMNNWDLSNCTHFDDMFAFYKPPVNIDLYGWIVPSAFDFNDTGIFDLESISDGSTLNLSNWSFGSRTDFSDLFKNVDTEFDITIDNWTTSDITDMSGMFEGARLHDESGYYGYYGFKVEGLSGWDTSSVTDMSNMFKGIHTNDITDVIPLSSLDYWDISSCQNFNHMLYNNDPEDWNYDLDHSDDPRKRPNWDGYWDDEGTFHPNDGTISGVMEFINVYQTAYYLNNIISNWDSYDINNGAVYVYDDSETDYNGLYAFDDGYWLVPNTLTLSSLDVDFNPETGYYPPGTTLPELVPALTVTQNYGDYDDAPIPFFVLYNDGENYANGYTLSGSLDVGINTITVSVDIGGTTQTATFEVEVRSDE